MENTRRPLSSALVAGASGFIGSALVHRLAERGVTVTGLTRRPSPAGAATPAGATLITVADYRPETLRRALAGRTADVVFNLAAAGVNPADRDHEALLVGNVGVVSGLLTALRDRRPCRIVHTGSCAQYGRLPPNTRASETLPLAPDSAYGAAKAAAEVFGDGYARELALPFVSLRPFMIYGPGEAPRRLLPQLISGLGRNEPVALSPGLQVRDFLFVEDLLDACIAVAEATQLNHRVYNVCSGSPTTVKAVGETLAALMHKPTDLLRWGARDYRPDDVPWLVGDARRLQNDTGWAPTVTLEEGLQRMVRAWAQDQATAPEAGVMP